MQVGAVLLGLLDVCLYCAIIVLVAFAIVWILNLIFGITPSADVMKWGKVVVALLCAIAIISFLLGLLPGGASYHPYLFRRTY